MCLYHPKKYLSWREDYGLGFFIYLLSFKSASNHEIRIKMLFKKKKKTNDQRFEKSLEYLNYSVVNVQLNSSLNKELLKIRAPSMLKILSSRFAKNYSSENKWKSPCIRLPFSGYTMV